jgi:hypothetical protein
MSIYTSSLYGLINVRNGEIGIGGTTPTPAFRTTENGLELGKQLSFINRPLGLGAETEVIRGNQSLTLNQNIPASYIHVNNPPGAWIIAVDGSNDNTRSDQNDVPRSVVVSASGKVFSTFDFDGYYYTIFRNPDGSSNIIPELESSNIYKYAAIACYSPSGVPQWHRIVGTSNIYGGLMYAPYVTVDSQDNAYVAGYAESTMSVYDSNQEKWWTSPNDQNQNGYGGYVVKYDTHGNPLWASFTGTSNEVQLFKHAIDSSNSVYAAGGFSVTTQGDPLIVYNGDGTLSNLGSLTSDAYNYAGLIEKFSEDGNLVWVNTIDGVSDDYVSQIIVDKNDHIIFAAYAEQDDTFSNVVIQSQNTSNIVLAGDNSTGAGIIGKYDTHGNALWVIQITNSPNLYGKAVALAVNDDNEIIVFVRKETDLTVTDADGTIVSVPDPSGGGGNSHACVLLKFNENGLYQSHTYITGTEFDEYATVYYSSSGLSVDSSGNIYVGVFGDPTSPVLTIYNPDGTSNVVDTNSLNELTSGGYHSTILKFNSHGYFLNTVAHFDGNYDANVLSIALDENRRRLYACVFGTSDDFAVSNRYGSNVYTFNNIDYLAGFVVGLNMDTGDVVAPGALILPAHESDSFTKDVYVTSLHPAPFTTYLELENRDHTYKFMPITLELSNVTVQKSFRWTSNSWVSTTQFEPTANGVNLVSYYYGDQPFATSGSNYIGANISWQNKVTDNKLAFRVTTKCSLASDDEIAYRYLDALVSPVDNETSNMPYGIVTAILGDTYATNFINLDHTILRSSDRSVDLKVTWDSSVTDYVGNVELQVLASTRLGDISFQPIHG